MLTGRDSIQCNVVLLNTSVTRRHERLSLDINKTWRSRNPGPTNDPLINGEPIAPCAVTFCGAGIEALR
jgi:adenylate cyclase